MITRLIDVGSCLSHRESFSIRKGVVTLDSGVGAGHQGNRRINFDTGRDSNSVIRFSAGSDAWLLWAQRLARHNEIEADGEGSSEEEHGNGRYGSYYNHSEGANSRLVRFHGRTVHSNGHLFGSCFEDSRAFWEHHSPSTSEFLHSWHALRPGGFVYSLEANQTCLMNAGFVNGGPEAMAPTEGGNPWLGFQVLALIKKSDSEICASNELNFQWVQPAIFPVSGPLRSRGSVRNYGVVWPGNHTCTKESPCPLVVFLSGIGEHSPGGKERDNTTEMRNSFRTLHKFGYLRYWDRDRDCASRLGTVLLFPELSREENWVKDGPDLLEHFVVPLINRVIRPHPLRIDERRLAIMGYSEGAFGVLHGAALYPHVFSFAIAASASVGARWWQDMPYTSSKPTPELMKAWKLNLVILGFGELDNTGNQSYNLERCLDYLDTAHVAPYTTVQVRYYAGLYHKEVWDRLFNHWPLFHRVFWQGRFQESKGLSLKQDAFQEILRMEERMEDWLNPSLPALL